MNAIAPPSIDVGGGGFDTGQVTALLDVLRGLGRAVQREIRGTLSPLGQEMLREATWNASRVSSRIPRSLSVRISLAARRPGIVLRASLAVAPHGRALEGLMQDTFRHPVFGGPRWVVQDTRPYMQPAVRAVLPRAREDVVTALNEIHRRAGLA